MKYYLMHTCSSALFLGYGYLLTDGAVVYMDMFIVCWFVC